MANVCDPKMPDKKFNFRYQYLLIELGTSLLRRTFDETLGASLVQHLKIYPKKQNRFKKLIEKGIITETQKLLLPPACPNPKTSSFDITLLYVLLRNIAGLKKVDDPVWTNPSKSDRSVEADVARLRMCRNKLSHSGSVYASKKQLGDDWFELSSILNSLNSKLRHKYPNLQEEIDSTINKPIDDELCRRHNETLLLWNKIDSYFDGKIEKMVASMRNVEQANERVEDVVSSMQRTLSELKEQLRHNIYDEQYRLHENMRYLSSTMSVLEKMVNSLIHNEPKYYIAITKEQMEDIIVKVFERLHGNESTTPGNLDTQAQRDSHDIKLEEDLKGLRKHLMEFYEKQFKMLPFVQGEEVELLDVYSKPSVVIHDDCMIQNDVDKSTKVTTYKEMLIKDGKCCSNIYLNAEPGMGKTAFCQRLCLIWSKAHSSDATSTRELEYDIEFLKTFEFLFFVPLRDSCHTGVIDLICTELQHFDEGLIKYALESKSCLIVLDGLDEWMPENEKYSKPDKLLSYSKCVYLTTTRSYNLISMRRQNCINDIDRLIEITGIHGEASEKYISDIVNYLNRKHSAIPDKRPVTFQSDMKRYGLDGNIHIPVICSQLVVLWFKGILNKMPRAKIYAENMNTYVKCTDRWQSTYTISNTETTLSKVCDLAFESLFSRHSSASSLIFTNKELKSKPYYITRKDINEMCRVGLLSKTVVQNGVKLSFIHSTYHEYFAALYVSVFGLHKCIDTIVQKWTCLWDFLKFSNFLVLLAGLSFNTARQLFQNLYDSSLDEFAALNAMAGHDMHDLGCNEQLLNLQNVTLQCMIEGKLCTGEISPLRLDNIIITYDADVNLIRQLLKYNKSVVKYIFVMNGDYLDEFSLMRNISTLRVENASSYNVAHFVHLIRNSKSTLQNLRVSGSLVAAIPVLTLDSLISISLHDSQLWHENIERLMSILSEKTRMTHIELNCLECKSHTGNECKTILLDLSKHSKLETFSLKNINVYCKELDSSTLQCITLNVSHDVESYFDSTFISLQWTQLLYLNISGICNEQAAQSLTSAIEHLPNLQFLRLSRVDFYDHMFSVSSGVRNAKFCLQGVRLTGKSLFRFLSCTVSKKYRRDIEFVGLNVCHTGKNGSYELKNTEVVELMIDCLKSMDDFFIVSQSGNAIHFATKVMDPFLLDGEIV